MMGPNDLLTPAFAGLQSGGTELSDTAVVLTSFRNRGVAR